MEQGEKKCRVSRLLLLSLCAYYYHFISSIKILLLFLFFQVLCLLLFTSHCILSIIIYLNSLSFCILSNSTIVIYGCYVIVNNVYDNNTFKKRGSQKFLTCYVEAHFFICLYTLAIQFNFIIYNQPEKQNSNIH